MALLRTTEVAEILDVSTHTVRQYVHDKKIRYIKAGNFFLFSLSDVKTFKARYQALNMSYATGKPVPKKKLQRFREIVVPCNETPLFCSDEAASYLGIGKKMLFSLSDRGFLKYESVGSKRFYKREDLDAFITSFEWNTTEK